MSIRTSLSLYLVSYLRFDLHSVLFFFKLFNCANSLICSLNKFEASSCSSNLTVALSFRAGPRAIVCTGPRCGSVYNVSFVTRKLTGMSRQIRTGLNKWMNYGTSV